jgi:AAA domain (dynein-related subfamily)
METMNAFEGSVTLRKDSKKSLTRDKVDEQLAVLKSKVESIGRIAKGWRVYTGEPVVSTVEIENGPRRARGNVPTTYINRVIFSIVCNPSTPRATLDGEFRNIVSILVAAGNGFPNWQVEQVNGEEWSAPSDPASGDGTATEVVAYSPVLLPGNSLEYFAHLYDRDAQIGIVMSALEAAIESDWRNRFHCVLYGPPACGKTELCAVIQTMLGDDAVWRIDCTATTQAGLTKQLDETEELPRIIIAEEIEKADPDALRVLLGLLDTRGEVRKVTARHNIRKECRVLMLATVNDIEKFEGLMAQALSSRFAHKVYCPRPGRELLEKILGRKVTLINGNPKWIAPTLDYMEHVKSYDPRRAIALCLSGRDRWLDMTYWKMLEELRAGLESDDAKGWQ